MSERPDRLYCLPGSEVCYQDPGTVWETEIEPFFDPEELDDFYEVEEWTVAPIDKSVPDATWIIEWITEHTSDDYGADEDPFEGILEDAAVVAAAEHLRTLIAAKCDWFMVNKKIAVHRITFGPDREPMWDNSPMYVKVAS